MHAHGLQNLRLHKGHSHFIQGGLSEDDSSQVIWKWLDKWRKTAVSHRMSSGVLHGDMWYVIFILASLLFIYYILLILGHLSHYKSPHYQSKSFGCPPFWGLILIGNCWETGEEKRGRQEEGEEQHRERRQTDRHTDRWQHHISRMRSPC